MSSKNSFKRSLQHCLKHNRDGSYSTQNKRAVNLILCAKQLKSLGYRVTDIKNIKPKHIDALVNHWQETSIRPGTIKNRLSYLRWLASKIQKPNIMYRTNDEYNVERRQYVKNDINIAKQLKSCEIERIKDVYVQNSLRLQQAFGLRREESIKFQPHLADRGDRIFLKASWCKGGREREVPILNQEQRNLLDELKQFCKKQKCIAMIPSNKNYKQQLHTYEHQTAYYEVLNNHGLRHYYAQQRYRDLTGWEPPKNGGMSYRKMNPEQRSKDRAARLQISRELGHNREDITAKYLGR